jgi:hypothetical protein
MPSSKPIKTTKNNVSSLLNTNILVVKFKTAYWSNKTTCVHYQPFVLVLLRKRKSFTQNMQKILTVLKPQTYAAVTAVNMTPELKYWKKNILSYDPVALLKKWDETGRRNSNTGDGHEKPCL